MQTLTETQEDNLNSSRSVTENNVIKNFRKTLSFTIFTVNVNVLSLLSL